MKFAITGGGGYTGYHIGWKLHEGGHTVLLLDIRPPDPAWRETAPKALHDALPHGKGIVRIETTNKASLSAADFWRGTEKERGKLEFISTDITNKDSLSTHLKGVDAVIHTGRLHNHLIIFQLIYLFFTASFGVSGSEQFSPHFDLQEKVNLKGTRNILEVSVENQVIIIIVSQLRYILC